MSSQTTPGCVVVVVDVVDVDVVVAGAVVVVVDVVDVVDVVVVGGSAFGSQSIAQLLMVS